MDKINAYTKKIRTTLICFLVFIVLMQNCQVHICSATNETIYVDGSGGADYTSVQEAVNAARDGDIVYVYSGTYYENLLITKEINLLGEDKTTTIIDGYSDEFNLIIHISSDNVNISGFTIQNSKNNYYSSGIIINNSENIIISNNTITKCKDGIILWNNSANNTIYNNNFVNNTNHINITSGSNTWNQIYPTGGNFWDDNYGSDLFSGTYQNISGSDGISDTSYNLSSGLINDSYPFTNQDGWLNNPPTAGAKGPYIAYINQIITFDGTDSCDIESNLSYLWDFGDNINGSGMLAEHIYSSPGSYTVSLTVTDDFGVTITDTTYAHIWDSTEGEWIFNATNDSFIYQKTPDVNYSLESYLEVSNNHGNNSSDWQRSLLIKFNLSLIPSITDITQAQLFLYYYDYDKNDTANRNLSIRKITGNWSENNITWNNRPTNSSTNTSNATVPSSFGWMNWNVLTDVKDFVKGNYINYGWEVMDLNYWGTHDIPITRFKSRETQTNLAPYLKIVYETPLIPCANGPYFGNISEEIQFNGSYLGSGIPPYIWRWDFGDGNSSIERNPTYIYSKEGEYTVNLIIMDSNGKGDNCSTSVIVDDPVVKLPAVEITNPVEGFYIHNNKIFSTKRTAIIGDIDIQVETTDGDLSVEKVEFYLNNQSKHTDTTIPYSWTWDKKPFLRFLNTIEVIVYDSMGNTDSEKIFVWRFL